MYCIKLYSVILKKEKIYVSSTKTMLHQRKEKSTLHQNTLH